MRINVICKKVWGTNPPMTAYFLSKNMRPFIL